MSAYIFLAGSIFILWCITKGGNIVCKLSHARNEKWNLFLSLSFFASFLLMAVRGISVGADTISYVKYYDCMRDLDWSELFTGGWNYHFFTTEKGFMILEKICNDLEIPTQMFLAICAAIFIFGVYKLAENYIGEYKLVAVYAFLALGGYLMAMNVMRQGIGVGICCLAWHELQ